MAKKLLEIAAEIVQAQVSTNQLATEEIVSSLKHVFDALRDLQKSEAEGVAQEDVTVAEKAGEKLNSRDSIREDSVVCLECGAEMRQLTAKHLASHQMSIREYKQRWGIPLRQSLSAKSLSLARSIAAKKRGLPEKLLQFQEERKRNRELAALESLAEESQGSAPDLVEKSKKPGRRQKKAALAAE